MIILSRPLLTLLALLASLALVSSCTSRTVKTANHQPVQRVNEMIPEAQLLDVGIQVFDTGLERALEDDDLMVFPEVRKAEARYMAMQLLEAVQSSAAWGAVRVIPEPRESIDLLVQGEILHSDGEQLVLKIEARDASGRLWLQKNYQGLASLYAYEGQRRPDGDPFQGVYNRIANDLLQFRQQHLAAADLEAIRRIARLRFANSFAPQVFSDYLQTNRQGEWQVRRLPAQNDPMLQRIDNIRERDYLFVDTLQDYYGNFVREMSGPYQQWRHETYNDIINLRKNQRSARNRTIAGIAAILGGIAAIGSQNGPATSTAGQVAVLGGGYLVKSGFDKRAESQIHVEALRELGDSLEANMQPRVIELEDRTYTLTGTVEDQYRQWRELLEDIYQLDTQGNATQDNAP